MIYTLPFIAAAIGWITNYLAIKMLFRPRKPVKVLFFTLQGIFPKRQKAFAENIGKVISEKLFSIEDIKEKVNSPAVREEIHKAVDEHLDHFLKNKLKERFPMLSMFINDKMIQQFKEILSSELDEVMPSIVNKMAERLGEEIDIQKLVSEKVASFSSDKVEEILFSIIKKELKFIELVGAVLGFFIGLVQVLLVFVS